MNLFGESFLFVALAVVVFLAASLVESICVIVGFIKCRVAQKAINYLETEIEPRLGVVLKSKNVGKPPDGKILNWIKEHFAGSVDSNDKYQLNIQNNRFVLLEYPSILTRSIPRSSLSFVPTLLTAISLLGTFWGISRGLSKFDLRAINESDKLLAAIALQIHVKT